MNEPTNRLAIYARVSTNEQSVETQLARLRTAVPGAEEYIDLGLSGTGVERPSLSRLRSAICSRHIASVHVVKLDRLGRSASAVLNFFDEAEAHGTRVIVLDQAIDTGTPIGRLVRTVLAAMAELEADLIRERTQEAMSSFKLGTRRTKSGRPVGRPRRLTAEIIQRIREERGKGLKWSIVAQHVGIPAGTCRKVGSGLPER
ncbi:MAG TPA: recombinase family protein [Thermoplasmata archaeon]|nr:recombinase family protein [Thermoplasmata archaeon]